MAKLEESDPRWIVSDRQDGKNVNAWHWEEKDLSKSVHESLKEIFKSRPLVDQDGMNLRIKEISEIDGDVTVAQRKSKIMCYFELKATLKWGGKVDGESVDGKMTIAEIEHDNFNEEFDISVSTTDSNAHSSKAEAWVRANARKVVRAEIRTFFEALFKQHQVGSAVPKGQSPAASSASGTTPTTASSPKPASPAPAAATSTSAKSTTSINWKMQWRVPIDELFAILMNEQRAAIYTRAPAKINPQSGGAFEYLGGVISGHYVKVAAPTDITMQWRLNSWPAGVFSSVVIKLSKEEPAVTRLDFAQAGIPDGEMERVMQGWRVNFFDAIKMVFGFGMEFL